MNYNRQRVRQQIINKLIQQAQKEKQECIQAGLNDPFEVYYYPTPLEDPQEIFKLQEKIKQKLIEQANMHKMKQIHQQISRELYIINQQIKTEEIEQQSLDLMIKQLEGQIKAQKIRKQIGKQKYNIQSSSIGCQTNQIKVRQIGTDYEQTYNITNMNLRETNKKSKFLSASSSYSINIYSMGTQSRQISNKNKDSIYKDKDLEHKKTIKIESKTNIQLANKVEQASALNLKQLNNDLQKQMKYLNHLKKSNRNRQYKDQKKKVKFLMQLFWKHAQFTEINEQNDISLPLIQI